MNFGIVTELNHMYLQAGASDTSRNDTNFNGQSILCHPQRSSWITLNLKSCNLLSNFSKGDQAIWW